MQLYIHAVTVLILSMKQSINLEHIELAHMDQK